MLLCNSLAFRWLLRTFFQFRDTKIPLGSTFSFPFSASTGICDTAYVVYVIIQEFEAGFLMG